MKIFKIVLVLFLMFTISVPALTYAADITRTFGWDEPEDLANITQWELYMSPTSGSGYDRVAIIPKIEAPPFQAPATVDIVGPPGTVQTRYFVLLACGDVLVNGVETYICSADSNEIAEEFTVPATEFKVPVNFRVIPES